MVARCLARAGVMPLEAREDVEPEGEEIFHPFSPQAHHDAQMRPWFWGYARSGASDHREPRTGTACCGKYSVSFHYVPAYLIYHINEQLYTCRGLE